MKRTCKETCDKILAVAPDGEFKTALAQFVESIFLELPEDGFDKYWRPAANIMAKYIPTEGGDPWHRQVLDLWFNKLKKQVITLTGPYTEDDICRFSALMREIERTRPNELFTMTVDDDGKTLEEAERLIRKAFVPVPGEEPVFKTIPKSEMERP